MDKIRENLGIVVREAREKTGLTQSELSEKLGLGDKTILNIENFRGNPKFDSLYPLVNFLKIPGDKLFYPELKDDEPNKHQLLLEIQSCNDREAAELLRVTRYMLELLRKRNSESPPPVKRVARRTAISL